MRSCKTANLNPMLPPCGETCCTKRTGRKNKLMTPLYFVFISSTFYGLWYGMFRCWWVFVPSGEWKRGQRGREGLKAVSQPISIQRLVQRLPRDPAHKHPTRGTSQEMSLHVTKNIKCKFLVLWSNLCLPNRLGSDHGHHPSAQPVPAAGQGARPPETLQQEGPAHGLDQEERVVQQPIGDASPPTHTHTYRFKNNSHRDTIEILFVELANM